MTARWRRSSIAAAALLGLVAGCAVGPDFTAPAAPQAAGWTAAPLPAQWPGAQPASADAPPQRFTDAASAPIDWWTAFGNPALDALVADALQHSPTLAAAEAALRQADELTAAQRGALFPSVTANESSTRGRVPDLTSSPLSSGATQYTLHTAQLSIRYPLDVFGGTRRAIESQQAQADAQRWQLRAARLTLAANVVNAALQEAALREQLQETEALQANAERQWHLMQTQQRLGANTGAAVHLQEAVLRQAEAAAAGLRKQLAQQHDLLAVLTGHLPADAPSGTLQLSALHLPDVPTGLPARLVEQRPDVRAAAEQLHAADAEVGVAVANMLPQLTLTGDYGSSASALRQLFRAGGLGWDVGAGLVQPLVDGGSLLHRKRAAEAQRDQTLAQYRGTVLGAFQDVADALEAVQHDADQHLAAVRAEAAARRALHSAERQLALGDTSRLALLTAEAAVLQASVARVQAEAGRYGDIVAMYQALGGSWREAGRDVAAR